VPGVRCRASFASATPSWLYRSHPPFDFRLDHFQIETRPALRLRELDEHLGILGNLPLQEDEAPELGKPVVLYRQEPGGILVSRILHQSNGQLSVCREACLKLNAGGQRIMHLIGVGLRNLSKKVRIYQK
jgi:hypothetical protein